MTIDRNAKIYVAGHTGLFGSALVRALKREGLTNLLTVTHSELDLTNQAATLAFFQTERPDYVYMAAAKVGGIHANDTYMADFAMENLQITCNTLQAAHESGVKKMLYLASSCIYPREAAQPVNESSILEGPLEPTNEGYAIAKIAGLRMCDFYKRQYGDNFISCIPANVYGENDSFASENNHVIPALIQRFHRAKENHTPFVEIWGTGSAEREFLYIDDAAEACLRIMETYEGPGAINIGVGETTSIRELVALVQQTVGYQGEIRYDTSKPDGMPRRLLDSGKIHALGWKASTSLSEGLRCEYEWFLKNVEGKCGTC